MLALTDADRFWCDCGNPKREHMDACEHCNYLDGRARIEGLVIAALRSLGGLSLVELCEVVYGSQTGERNGASGGYRHIRGSVRNPERVMHGLTQRLMARGRLRRYWQEGDSHASAASGVRGWRSPAWGARRGRWVYVLNSTARSTMFGVSW